MQPFPESPRPESVVAAGAEPALPVGVGPGIFHTIFTHSPEAIALTRVRDGAVVQVNEEWLRMTGYERPDVLGRTAIELGHWLYPEQRAQIFSRLEPGGRVVDAEVTLVMKNGAPRMVRLNASMISEGGEAFILIYLRDVTADQLAEQALRAGEEALAQANATMNRQVKLHELTESVARVGYWVSYPGDDTVHLSAGLAQMAGWEGESLVTTDMLWSRVFPEDLPALQQAQARMDGAVVEFRSRAQDGRVLWARSRMHRQVADGHVLADFGVIQEFTEEREVRESLRKQLEFVQKITSRAPGMLYEFQCWPDGRLTFPFVSSAVHQFFGASVEEVKKDARAVLERIHPDDIPQVRDTTQEALRSMRPWSCEFRTRENGEAERWFLGTSVPELLADGSVLFTGSITDITTQKQALGRLKESEERFRSLSSLSSDWYWEQDEQFCFTRIDGDGTNADRLAPQAALGRVRWDSGGLGVTLDQWAAHRAVLEAHQTFQDFEMQRVMSDGTYMWVSVSGTPIFDSQGVFRGYRGTGRDITPRKTAEAEIERLAFFDALTALPNRRMLIDRLGHALSASDRRGKHGALLFIDLDNFKVLNDTLGHHTGDLLLQQVAQRVQSCVRSMDTVARLGGDEFVVMLEELDADATVAASEAEVVAKKILSALNKQFALGSHNMHSSPSIGVTLFFRRTDSIEELLKRADLAMYQAKSAGRNTLRFFDPAMQSAASARADMEADLRTALQDEQFVLYYQPVVSADGAVTGVEALVRWQHPHKGMVSPGDFIPVAEQTGLILPLGQWVLEAACAQLVAWSDTPRTQRLSVAVNVSTRQFRHPDFSTHILDLLRTSGANPYRLKLELTESLLLSDFDEAILKMGELRSIGVSFSLDDFGTGYSSLAYLKRLPLDQLKIDKSFVRDVLTDPNDAAIARTILSLAKSLDLGVVAEGVESAGQRDFLLAAGCRSFQGYFFGRPVPVSQLQLG
ncbi:EAL domain-containing protein [Rhodoferax sp.]|uniref:sensor domain-containing protein n=1 Tax=Rhodoferax sp. TaxID=50421 RepID=UPI0025E8518A|nr:EAL domain-containing protein [Rhodoferax sp.]